MGRQGNGTGGPLPKDVVGRLFTQFADSVGAQGQDLGHGKSRRRPVPETEESWSRSLEFRYS